MESCRQKDVELFCELSPGAVASYRIGDGSIEMLAFSEQLPALLGFTHDEYARRGAGDITRLVVEQDRAPLRRTIAAAAVSGEDVDYSYRVILDNGVYHWMNVRGRLVGEMDGDPVFLAEFLDTTRGTQMHANLLDNASSGIYICDEATRELLYVNRKAMDFWGRDGDYCGHTCHEFFRGRNGICPWCVCGDITDQPISVESSEDPDHGGFLKIRCSRLLWCGRPSFCVVFDDITGEQRARAELENIVENIPAALLVYRERDGVSELVKANGAVEEIAGLSSEAIIGQGNTQGIREHVHPDDAEVVRRGLERMFSPSHEAEFAYRNRPSEGAP